MICDNAKNTGLDLQGLEYLVVGAGFFGATIAERIAADKKRKVAIIEKRNHIGGNSYSDFDPGTGIEWHRYGSHIFHTKCREAWQYVNRFGSFNNYRHKVLSSYNGRLYPLPINLATINLFYDRNMNPQEAKEFISSEASKENDRKEENLEGRALSFLGRPLYEAFIKGYTEKQWGMNASSLPADIINRLPVRFDYDADYFDDPWQGIPADGYGHLLHQILGHKNIDTYLGVDFFDIRERVPNNCLLIYSGSIDRFFDYRYGRLKWRSLRFEQEILAVGDYQGTSVINFPEISKSFTRIHEYRHFHKDRSYPDDQTIICREYPVASFRDDEPYYPVNTHGDRKIHELYESELQSMPNVLAGGRLGSYSYINMDQAITSALHLYDKSIRDRQEQ